MTRTKNAKGNDTRLTHEERLRKARERLTAFYRIAFDSEPTEDEARAIVAVSQDAIRSRYQWTQDASGARTLQRITDETEPARRGGQIFVVTDSHGVPRSVSLDERAAVVAFADPIYRDGWDVVPAHFTLD